MSKINIKIVLCISVCVALFSSCNIYKKFEMPKTGLTGEYAEAASAPVDSTSLGNISWRQMFTDPALQNLIETALENNTDMKNAKLNIDIAQANLKGAKMNFAPAISLAPNGGAASYDGSRLSWSYTIPLSVSWEIDVFGRLLNAKRSAQASVLQSEAYQQAVRSQLISAVANTYYSIVMLQRQLELSRETAEKWGQSVEIMKDMKLAGRVNEAGVVQSEANYYAVMASIPDLEQNLDQMQTTLSLLLGSMPREWQINTHTNQTFPEVLVDGVPMRALSARPDVKSSEQSLAMAYYATNQARSAFYPNLTISAQGGYTNLLGAVITNPGVFFYQLAGSLAIPLFNRGTNIANLAASKAKQEQAMNTFEYTLMNASAEVSDALVMYNKSREKSMLLVHQVEKLEKSVEYTQELLKLGTSTYLEVLTAQQSLLSAQMNDISCWHTQMQAVINLYQSLGGGR